MVLMANRQGICISLGRCCFVSILSSTSPRQHKVKQSAWGQCELRKNLHPLVCLLVASWGFYGTTELENHEEQLNVAFLPTFFPHLCLYFCFAVVHFAIETISLPGQPYYFTDGQPENEKRVALLRALWKKELSKITPDDSSPWIIPSLWVLVGPIGCFYPRPW